MYAIYNMISKLPHVGGSENVEAIFNFYPIDCLNCTMSSVCLYQGQNYCKKYILHIPKRKS